jgi:hypothetical protein
VPYTARQARRYVPWLKTESPMKLGTSYLKQLTANDGTVADGAASPGHCASHAVTHHAMPHRQLYPPTETQTEDAGGAAYRLNDRKVRPASGQW